MTQDLRVPRSNKDQALQAERAELSKWQERADRYRSMVIAVSDGADRIDTEITDANRRGDGDLVNRLEQIKEEIRQSPHADLEAKQRDYEARFEQCQQKCEKIRQTIDVLEGIHTVDTRPSVTPPAPTEASGPRWWSSLMAPLLVLVGGALILSFSDIWRRGPAQDLAIQGVSDRVTAVEESLKTSSSEVRTTITESQKQTTASITGHTEAVTLAINSQSNRVTDLSSRMTSVEDQVNEVDKKVVSIDGKVATLDKNVALIGRKIATLDKKADAILQLVSDRENKPVTARPNDESIAPVVAKANDRSLTTTSKKGT